MSVRAKFKCESVQPSTTSEEAVSITLYPVVSGSPENEQFFCHTPSGYISFGCVNQSATKQFTPGAEYYVDFTQAGEGIGDDTHGDGSDRTCDGEKVH